MVAVWHYSSYEPNDLHIGEVDLEYDFPADTSFTALDSHTFGEFAQNNNLLIFQTSITAFSDTTDDFVLKVSTTDEPSGVRGVAILSLCIGDGGDEGESGGGLLEANCNIISTPAGNDLSTWISWLWAKLNQFYRCELMVLLNSLYNFLQKSWITVTWSIRWSQAATVMTVNWFGRDFVGWLGGHLSNIAVGQVTTITTTEQCGNVFCLLQSLVNGVSDIITTLLEGIRDILEDVIGAVYDLLSTALNAIINILQQILSFIFSVLGLVIGIAVDIVGLILQIVAKAMELFDLMRQLLSTLLTSWLNAEPIMWDILPSCKFDQTSFRCMFFYICERTIFTESGSSFITVIVAGLWMNTFFFVIYRVKAALIDLGIW